MNFIDRILGRNLSLSKICKNFESDAHALFLEIEERTPVHRASGSGEKKWVDRALDAFREDFSKVAELEHRSVQIRKLMGLYFKAKQDEITFEYFSSECPDEFLALHCISMNANGDNSLSTLADWTKVAGKNYQNFAKIEKAHFKKKVIFDIYKNEVLRGLIAEFSGRDFDDKDLPRYELMIKEHVKKLGLELMLKNVDQNDVLYPISLRYDFSEMQSRSNLIARFIKGVEINSDVYIDRACEEFPVLLQKNFDVYEDFKNNVQF